MDDRVRYENALHAVQTGVKMEMETNPRATEPKHLRVGINSAHVSISAIVRLLIEKGVITDDEIMKMTADEMEKEQMRYEMNISRALGSNVTLG